MSVGKAGAVSVKMTLDGIDVPEDHQGSFVVERDIRQPAMAAIVVYNQDHRYSKLKVTGDVEIKIGKEQKSIYKGEIVGLEPTYKGGEPQQIISQVIGDAGLSLDWKHEKTITYKHVYQHNQSAMEFVRTRAARMGCHLWCVDTTLHCKQPDLSNDSGIELKISQGIAEGEQLRNFSPRISSAPINKKV